ncbi:unnamed protein product [Mesocestoides corti]|uniref:Uncharacterized protein n=2 Tax=Mesocestoides corti TaxID=53468 RepID=A0A0R3U5T1_MESCO|nr:unnamed protein product [Mesocestoides corti]
MRQQGRSSHVVAPTPLALSQVYKTPTSSLRQTTLASTQNSTSSRSRVTPSEWNSPRTPLKQVRYDTRGPVELDASWHSRSSSEPSQNFRLEDALTVVTLPG